MAILLGGFGVGAPFAKFFLRRSFRRTSVTDNREREAVVRSYQAAITYITCDTRRAMANYPIAHEIIGRYGSDWELNFALHAYVLVENLPLFFTS